MSDAEKVDYEAIGRYHAAMREARIALTKRDRAVSDLRELLSQVIAPGHAEFRVGGELLQQAAWRAQSVLDSDDRLSRGVREAAKHAAAAGEDGPLIERMVMPPSVSAEVKYLDAVTIVAHDPARDVSGGN